MKKKRDTKPSETEIDSQNDSANEGSSVPPEGNSEDCQDSAQEAPDELGLLRRQLDRAKADLANIRKRHRKELDEARGRAIEGFANELLPVLDNFHLALDAHKAKDHDAGSDIQSMLEGLIMVRSLLEGALERHGLAEIPSVDKAFDPNLHEAIAMDPSSAAPAGQITQVVQRGYQLEGRVLRASRVMVSGGPDQTENREAGSPQDRQTKGEPEEGS